MKIAQIAPIVERVPPHTYGGTERVISALTEELVQRGHEVTLFASGDSLTQAKLVSICDVSLRKAGINGVRDRNGWILQHIGMAYDHAAEFDVIHDHSGVFSLPTAELSPTPVIQTMHGAFYEHNVGVFTTLRRTHVVAISQNQTAGLHGMNLLSTVYNGLPMDHYPFSDKVGSYLLYVGRITPQKGTHLAVQLALKTGLPLILAAKLDPDQVSYFNETVKPYLSEKIRWIGEVDEVQRNELMKNALCFIHPGLWREPFGLTLVEAMACGCPVIALKNGAIPEIIDHGKTGFIAHTLDQMAEYVGRAHTIDRVMCRTHALANFSASTMTDHYEELYEQIAKIPAPAQSKLKLPNFLQTDWFPPKAFA